MDSASLLENEQNQSRFGSCKISAIVSCYMATGSSHFQQSPHPGVFGTFSRDRRKLLDAVCHMRSVFVVGLWAARSVLLGVARFACWGVFHTLQSTDLLSRESVPAHAP